MTMNPPPPMLPALGCVTARANAVATAASIALPPFLRPAAPAPDAGAEVDTTIPFRDETIALSACCAAALATAAKGSNKCLSGLSMRRPQMTVVRELTECGGGLSRQR